MQGKVLLLSKDAVKPWLKCLHFSPLTWASKPTDEGFDPMGRTCFNLSCGGSKSVNHGTDVEASDVCYPLQRLPDIRCICELASRQRQHHGESELGGVTVDAFKAYTQFQNSVETSKLFATYLLFPLKVVVAIYLVGAFGYTRAGHIYCLFARAISFHHNLGKPICASVTYIDDGVLISPSPVLMTEVDHYCEGVKSVFGPDACNPKKTKLHGQDLIALGWHFTLRYDVWKVTPKPRAIKKMFAAVFVWIPPGVTRIENELLHKVLSILSWYLKALPAGSAFLASIFACLDQGSSPRRWTCLTPAAVMDLDWLRGIVLAARMDPLLLAASISHLRRDLCPSLVMFTDASTSFGGGGLLQDKDGVEICRGQISWSKEEIDLITNACLSINVLEYFTMTYFILMWGVHLKGMVVRAWCDNTAAVSWLIRMRGCSKSTASLGIVRVLSLFCQINDIALCPAHIAGTDNNVADALSRFPLQERTEELPNSEGAGWWTSCGRKDACRELLRISVLEPERLQSLNLLSVLRSLACAPGPDFVSTSN